MIYEVYSVYDKAVKAYLQPFFMRSKGEAIRSFSAAVNDEKGPFSRNRDDYVLYFVGVFDDNTGLFTSGESQRVLGAAEVAGPEREPFKALS